MYYPCRSKSYCFQANVEAEYEHYYPLSSLINRTCIILIVVLFLLPFFILIIRSLSVIFCVLIPTMCCAFSEQLLLIVVSESATDMVGDIFCSGALSWAEIVMVTAPGDLYYCTAYCLLCKSSTAKERSLIILFYSIGICNVIIMFFPVYWVYQFSWQFIQMTLCHAKHNTMVINSA